MNAKQFLSLPNHYECHLQTIPLAQPATTTATAPAPNALRVRGIVLRVLILKLNSFSFVRFSGRSGGGGT